MAWPAHPIITATSGGLNFAVNFAKAIPETPAIEGFLERCLSRPAFARVTAKDQAAQSAAS